MFSHMQLTRTRFRFGDAHNMISALMERRRRELSDFYLSVESVEVALSSIPMMVLHYLT